MGVTVENNAHAHASRSPFSGFDFEKSSRYIKQRRTLFFLFTQVQTPVTVCSGELWSILVVRRAHNADLRSRLRHVSSPPSVAYSTGCSRVVTHPGTSVTYVIKLENGECIEVVHGRLRPNIHTLWTVVVRARDWEHAYREKKHQFWSLADYFGFYVEELAHLQQEIFHKEMDCPLGEPTSRYLGVLTCKVRPVLTEERSRPHPMPSDFEESKCVNEVPVHFPPCKSATLQH